MENHICKVFDIICGEDGGSWKSCSPRSRKGKGSEKHKGKEKTPTRNMLSRLGFIHSVIFLQLK